MHCLTRRTPMMQGLDVESCWSIIRTLAISVDMHLECLDCFRMHGPLSQALQLKQENRKKKKTLGFGSSAGFSFLNLPARSIWISLPICFRGARARRIWTLCQQFQTALRAACPEWQDADFGKTWVDLSSCMHPFFAPADFWTERTPERLPLFGCSRL